MLVKSNTVNVQHIGHHKECLPSSNSPHFQFSMQCPNLLNCRTRKRKQKQLQRRRRRRHKQRNERKRKQLQRKKSSEGHSPQKHSLKAKLHLEIRCVSNHLFNAGCAHASGTKTVYAHVCLLQNLHLVFVLTVGVSTLQTQLLQAGAGGPDAIQPSACNTKLVKKVCYMVLQQHQSLLTQTSACARALSMSHDSAMMFSSIAAEEGWDS